MTEEVDCTVIAGGASGRTFDVAACLKLVEVSPNTVLWPGSDTAASKGLTGSV